MAKFSKQELQNLVDDHARLGLQDHRIKTHLRESHGVALAEVIPPPTKSAQRARERIFATGIVDTAGMKSKDGIILSEQSSSAASTSISAPLDLSQEQMQKIMNEVAAKHGISSPTVQMHEIREQSWRESQAVFFSKAYRGTGPTLLDRMIHGYSSIYQEIGFRAGSNFEVFRKCLVSKADKGIFDPGMLSGDFVEEWNIHKAMDVSLYPWFKPGCETINIQIDAEMAEIFLAGKAPPSGSWTKEFLTKPIYIDIHEKTCGERTISGIFCRPAPSQGTFSYMAVVEWIGQGCEAFIFGEYAKPGQAVVMFTGDVEDEDENLTQEILDAIYDPMIQQIEKIAAMAYMYCRTKMDARQPINPLATMPRASGGSTNEKKERNKEKTHSYFRVLKLDIPPDRFGFTGKTSKSWTLDHLLAVTGHFRWQLYGAGNNLRKLIWIDAYEKGQGARHRPAENPFLVQVPAVERS